MEEVVKIPRSGKYIIVCDPIPWARPGQSGNHRFDTQRQSKIIYASHIEEQHNNEPLFQGPLLLEVTFFMRMPGFRPKLREKILGKSHHTKPDLSNLVKFIEDVSESILYHNDSYISCIKAQKIYAEQPRTEFIITEIV